MRFSMMIVAACALLQGMDRASAHAFLKAAVPPVGSTVQQAPTEVVIDFTEGVEPGFSTIVVQDRSGADMETGAAHSVGAKTRLAIGLKPLSPGVYTVIWHATAVDTHKTEGNFSFTVAKYPTALDRPRKVPASQDRLHELARP